MRIGSILWLLNTGVVLVLRVVDRGALGVAVAPSFFLLTSPACFCFNEEAASEHGRDGSPTLSTAVCQRGTINRYMAHIPF